MNDYCKLSMKHRELENGTAAITHESHSVAVYLVDRARGGPEEGGWWFDSGELVRSFRNAERAYEYSRQLNTRLRSRSFGPNADRREISSVLSDGEYQAIVCTGAVDQMFPSRKPHYE